MNLGIDIGGTKISYALIDNFGNIQSEVEKKTTPKTLDEIKNTLKEIVGKFENKVDLIGIATAGAVNRENTRVIGSTGNLPRGYNTIDFQGLSNKIVFVENDANCACWAEYKIGASKGFSNSIMLTLGTGVGGGIIVDDRLLKGKSGAAGEMHFVISRKPQRPCTCGFYDCFEAYASGNGLRQTGVEIFNNKDITTYDIIELANKGDNKALEALERWQKDIALGIVGLVNIFDPDCVVLSGSMAEFVDTEMITNEVNKQIVTTPTKVVKALAGNYSGMIGAALLAFRKGF